MREYMSPVVSLRGRRLGRRLVQLYLGLTAYGVSMALMVRSNLGVMPWDVLHQGIARRLDVNLGLVTIIVGAMVLAAWIPLRERPGLGTISNVVVVGIAVDLTLVLLPESTGWLAGTAFGVCGIVLNGMATAAYVGVSLGPGPRDGLMTGLARRTGRSLGFVRTCIELMVIFLGWFLGGTLGAITVLYAVTIGPLVQVFMPRFSVPIPSRTAPKADCCASDR